MKWELAAVVSLPLICMNIHSGRKLQEQQELALELVKLQEALVERVEKVNYRCKSIENHLIQQEKWLNLRKLVDSKTALRRELWQEMRNNDRHSNGAASDGES